MSEVRICDNCNYHNKINNLECEKCGYDLSFVIPTDESILNEKVSDGSAKNESNDCLGKESNPSLILVSLDGQITIPIVDELVIGRDGEYSAYFDKSNFVSRQHAIFNIEGNTVFISDASTNGTFVNDKKLSKLIKTPIKSSDKIMFADVIFEVKNAN